MFRLVMQAIARASFDSVRGGRLLPRPRSQYASAHCGLPLQDWQFIQPNAELPPRGSAFSRAARDIAYGAREFSRAIHHRVLPDTDFPLPAADFFGSARHFRRAVWHFRRRDGMIRRSPRHIATLGAEIVRLIRDMRSGVWQFGLARMSSFSRASRRTDCTAGATRCSARATPGTARAHARRLGPHAALL